MAEVEILRVHEVLRRTKLSRATLYRLMAKSGPDAFPQPIPFGPTRVWVAAEVEAWVARQLKVGLEYRDTHARVSA